MKKVVMLLLAVTLLLGLFGAFAMSADSDVDAVVMNFAGSAGMLKSKVDRLIYGPDPNESGICTMDKEKKAWKIEFAGHEWKGDYRFMPLFKDKNRLSKEHRYIRVKFLAECDGYYVLWMHHNGAPTASVKLCDAGGVKAGEWYVSPPVEINDALWTRINNGSHFTLGFVSGFDDAVFYIQEVSFFKSQKDAYVYYGEDDKYESAAPAVSRMTFATPTNASVLHTTQYPLYKDENGLQHYDTGYSEYDEEEDAMRLIYSPTAGEDGKAADYYRGNYRFMPSMNAELRTETTVEKCYVRVLYKATNPKGETDPVRLFWANNGNWKNDFFVLEDDVKDTNGKYVLTDTVKLSETAMERMVTKGSWMTMAFDASNNGGEYFIKDIYFFGSQEEADAFTGDYDSFVNPSSGEKKENSVYAWATFSDPSNLKVFRSTGVLVFEDENGVKHYDTGLSEYDETEDAQKLLYSPGVDKNGNIEKFRFTNYRVMPQMVDAMKKTFDPMYRYIRVVYKATNPEKETEPVALKFINNATWHSNGTYVLEHDVQNTNGEWTVSDPVYLADSEMTRLQNQWITLGFDALHEGGEYYIKDVYYFPTKADAEAFSLESTSSDITLGGVPIEKYRIVINDEDAMEIATLIRSQIRYLTGERVEIVMDTEPETEYEILVGMTNRKESQLYYAPVTGKFVNGEIGIEKNIAKMEGTKLVLAAGTYWSLDLSVQEFLSYFLGYGWTQKPDSIHLDSDFEYNTTCREYILDPWVGIEETVLDESIVYTDDFEDEEGNPDYWMEYVQDDLWKVKEEDGNNVYAVDADKLTVSWLHVFDRDVDYSFRFRAEDLADNAKMGMYARYTYDTSYVAVGYDMARGAWYVEKREGNIFIPFTLALYEDELKEGEWYDVRVELIDKSIKVYLNGSEEPIMTSDFVEQDTSGRPGLFAQGAKVAFDDINLTLVSGQGRLQDGVVDLSFGLDANGVPVEEQFYCCGGSFLELEDNSLLFLYPGHQYISDDYGLTWEPTNFVSLTNIPSVIRLQSGALLQMYQTTKDGKKCHIARWSGDDGKTWEDRGIISYDDYMGYGTMKGINMNEKLMQMSDGRIFASQNFDGAIPKGKPNDHCTVLVELYYSDDEGKTWTKSETGSYDTTDEAQWGESQVLEAADGRLVWLTGWNKTNWIWYSFSEDNGITWSKAEKSHVVMSHSSVVTYRDPYADELTYYMLFVYNEADSSAKGLSRSRLALARSYDAVNWEYLMDVDRWEAPICYQTNSLYHYVNPGIYVTEDYVYVACGRSIEPIDSPESGHHWQINIARRIEKDKLVAYDVWPNTNPSAR